MQEPGAEFGKPYRARPPDQRIVMCRGPMPAEQGLRRPSAIRSAGVRKPCSSTLTLGDDTLRGADVFAAPQTLFTNEELRLDLKTHSKGSAMTLELRHVCDI